MALNPQPPPGEDSRPVSFGRSSPDVLLGHVRRVGWRPVTRGLYVPATAPDSPSQQARAWRCVLGDEVTFTALTAATLRGWWLPTLPADVPMFIAIRDDSTRPRRAGLRVSRHPSDVPSVRLGGLDVATPGETMLACARYLSLLDLVILGDAALHRGDCTGQDLRAAAGQRRRGARVLRRALPLLDGRSESPGETLLRLLHTSCGVPVEPQFVVKDRGQLVARADLRIAGTRRLPEYDGAYHRDPAQYERDRGRDRRLLALGWEAYSYSIASVLAAPARILRDADEALGRDHRPQRIKAFYSLLNPSSYTAGGSGHLRTRLGGRATKA